MDQDPKVFNLYCIGGVSWILYCFSYECFNIYNYDLRTFKNIILTLRIPENVQSATVGNVYVNHIMHWKISMSSRSEIKVKKN